MPYGSGYELRKNSLAAAQLFLGSIHSLRVPLLRLVWQTRWMLSVLWWSPACLLVVWVRGRVMEFHVQVRRCSANGTHTPTFGHQSPAQAKGHSLGIASASFKRTPPDGPSRSPLESELSCQGSMLGLKRSGKGNFSPCRWASNGRTHVPSTPNATCRPVVEVHITSLLPGCHCMMAVAQSSPRTPPVEGIQLVSYPKAVFRRFSEILQKTSSFNGVGFCQQPDVTILEI